MPSSTTSYVDVLLIGAGPSGLMLATWLARTGVKTRIVDKRFELLNSGQADGLQSRTFEIFDSLGFGQQIWAEANHMLEIRFWNPDKDGKLSRTDRMVDTMPGLSRFQQATLHQARIEDYLLRYIRKYSNIETEYHIMPEFLSVDTDQVEDDGAYPIKVILRHLAKPPAVSNGTSESQTAIPNGMFRSNLVADVTDKVLDEAKADTESYTEVVRAKYVVGTDGAHSWTRRQIGSIMEGEQTDFVWGVLDIIPITDFPDIRYRCAVHSAFGSIMIIPREDKFVRLYIQVTEVGEDGKAIDRFKITPQTLIEAAAKILSPYKLTYKHCHWWTAYRIGQRVGSKFSAHNRVFLAGDAVHTHSPKAGQGMNISMHDSFNLGWKLSSVIKGRAKRSLLDTYGLERRQIAQELIAFDQQFSRLFSGRPTSEVADESGVNLKTFKEVFEKGNLFASGCAVDYVTNLIVAKSREHKNRIGAHFFQTYASVVDENCLPVVYGKQHLAQNIPIGMRIPSYKILNQSDARPWHLQELLPSNGAWRILVFAGNISDRGQLSRYEALGKSLSSAESFYTKFNGRSIPDNPVFELLTIHSAPRNEIELLDLPDIFHPCSEEYGWDYCKVFVDDVSYHEGHGEAYKNYGIDPHSGCMVVVRPDQYVSWIGELEDVEEMGSFFASFM
ncbi:FAD binding domain-containing protein [Cladophialophora immunda]|nr:FAD binding domain-containing protein [Cladophialophora immunda]